MSLADPLQIMQQECCDLLSADPAFDNVPVINEDSGNVEDTYARAMGTETVTGGKIGACVTVATLNADADFENIPGPFLNDVGLIAFIEENVQINRDATIGTLQTAKALATRIAALWHQAQPLSCSGPLVVIKPTIQRLIAFDQLTTDGKIAYRVNARASVLLSANLPQAAAPAGNDVAGIVTLSSATSGAAIFYTTNGSNPQPRNGTLYTAPFFAGPGGHVRARAWLAGYLASETTTINT